MNKLTRIEELARKLNQEILALEVVQEYQKYEKLVLNDEKLKQLEKELNIDGVMIRRWVRMYLLKGESALENKKKPGNPLAKYSRRKSLSEIEQLEYENLKLRIENERLKKGYIVKGDGSIVIFKK